MTNVSQPDVNMPIVGANTVAENAAQRMSLVGTKLAGGSATAGELITGIEKSAAKTLLGDGSELYDAYLAARLLNKVTPIDIVPLDEPAGGVAAVGAILGDGVALETKDIEVGIASYRNGVATISVVIDDTSDDVADKITAAFATLTENVCTVTTDVTTTDQNNITYNHKGIQGNSCFIYVKGSVAGMTFGITAMQGGAGEPVLTATYAEFGNTRYQSVAQVGEWGVVELIAFLAARWNVRNKIVDGTGFVYLSDTMANHQTAVALLNQKEIVYKCEGLEDKSWYKGTSVEENNFARAAQAAAIKALRLTTGADISAFVNTAGGVDDGQGGIAISSLPYFNTPMPWPVMATGFGFTDPDEIEALKELGGCVDGNNDANTNMVYGEVVTTYKTDSNGDADDSFKNLEYVDTISSFREYCFNNIKKDCRQSRATSGSLKPRRNMNNELSVTNSFIAYFSDSADSLLVQAGEEALQFFKSKLDVTLELQKGTFAVSMVAPIVTQVREIYAPIQMSFTL